MSHEEIVDPITGEVTEVCSDESGVFAEWEHGLAVLWKGNLDIGFDYQSTKSGLKPRALVLTRVLYGGSGVYLGGIYPGQKMFKTFLLDRIKSQVRHPEGVDNVPDFLATLGVDLTALPPLAEAKPQKAPSRPSRRRRGPDMNEILLGAVAVQAHDVLMGFADKMRRLLEVQVKKSVVSEAGELFLVGVNTATGETECFAFADVAGKLTAHGKSWQRRTFLRDVLGYEVD